MGLLLYLVGFFSCFLGPSLFEFASAQESGHCDGLENLPGRNQLFNGTLQINPCAKTKIQKCLDPPQKIKSDEAACAVKDDPGKCSFKLLVSEYNKWSKTIKVSLIMPIHTEFFIEVQSTRNESRLGHFEDAVFRDCNSYACCDPRDRSRTDVARSCPSVSTNASLSLSFNTQFYTLGTLWHVPEDLEDDVIFVASFIPAASKHWEAVKSEVVHISTRKPKEMGSSSSTTVLYEESEHLDSSSSTENPNMVTENTTNIDSDSDSTTKSLEMNITTTTGKPTKDRKVERNRHRRPKPKKHNARTKPKKSSGKSLKRHYRWPTFDNETTIVIIKKKRKPKVLRTTTVMPLTTTAAEPSFSIAKKPGWELVWVDRT